VLRAVARVRVYATEDAESVQRLVDEAMAIAARDRLPYLEARLLATQAVLDNRRHRGGDLSAYFECQRRSLELRRRHGPRSSLGGGLVNMALACGFQRRVPEQLALLDEARALAEEQGQEALLAFCCSVTGSALAEQRRYAEAAAMSLRCARLAWELADWRVWFYALWNLPRILARLHRPEAAARLIGFAQAFYGERFGTLGSEDLPVARRTRRLVQAQLGVVRTDALWREGAALTMADAMRLTVSEAERVAS
jgi:hypothetical protein